MSTSGVASAAGREFHYRVGWRTGQVLPGHHRSRRAGAGFDYAASVPLLDYPDPRRVDIRQSVRDPFGQLFVRKYHQHSILPVYAVADLTASMSFDGVAAKLKILTEFLSILAYSAGRTGDPLGLVGCADKVLPQFALTATRNGEAIREVLHRLSDYEPVAGGAQALIDAAPLVGFKRALVFLISDFHFPLDELRRVLRALGKHDIVPIVLWDSVEFRNPPTFGMARVRDSETGVERYTWMRASVRQRLLDVFDRRRADLNSVFLEAGCKPYFLLDKIDCDSLNSFFIDR